MWYWDIAKDSRIEDKIEKKKDLFYLYTDVEGDGYDGVEDDGIGEEDEHRDDGRTSHRILNILYQDFSLAKKKLQPKRWRSCGNKDGLT